MQEQKPQLIFNQLFLSPSLPVGQIQGKCGAKGPLFFDKEQGEAMIILGHESMRAYSYQERVELLERLGRSQMHATFTQFGNALMRIPVRGNRAVQAVRQPGGGCRVTVGGRYVGGGKIVFSLQSSVDLVVQACLDRAIDENEGILALRSLMEAGICPTTVQQMLQDIAPVDDDDEDDGLVDILLRMIGLGRRR